MKQNQKLSSEKANKQSNIAGLSKKKKALKNAGNVTASGHMLETTPLHPE